MVIYRGEFSGLEDVKREFHIGEDTLQGVEILYAEYDFESYEGYAFILFKKDDELYEVNGGHCSCYGLENQWEPARVTVKSLMMRPKVLYDIELLTVVQKLDLNKS